VDLGGTGLVLATHDPCPWGAISGAASGRTSPRQWACGHWVRWPAPGSMST